MTDKRKELKELEKINNTTWEELHPDWAAYGDMTANFAKCQFDTCPACDKFEQLEVLNTGEDDPVVCVCCRPCGWFAYGDTPTEAIENWNRRYDHAAAELRWIPVSERLPSVDDAKEWKSEQSGVFISPELEDYVAKLMSDYAMEVLARSGYFNGRDHKGE